MTRLAPRPRHAAAGFRDAFGQTADRVWSAPGRVNLLGEHTDYNDGLCLPMAVDFRADCAVRETSTGRLRIASAQRPGELLDVPLEGLGPGSVPGWAAYVAGAVWVHPRRLSGLDVLVDSDVPEGAGLSSSAALECATLGALGGLEGLELALLAQRAENEFVGVPCGLMDQLASTLCRPGAVLLLDAQSSSTQHVPLDLAGSCLELLVLDTQAPHQLSDGGYAQRRQECERAAAALGVPSLRLATGWDGLPSPERERARHVVTEIARVEDAVDLLDAGRLPAVGPLMDASHASLRDDFEVTVPALDVAVEAATGAGAVGARMTGGGFGGSIVALCSDATAVATVVEVAFADRGWTDPRWFICTPAAGLFEVPP